MVDQAPVRTTNSPDGQQLPPQAVARTSLEFVRDLTTLGELQLRLMGVDLKLGLNRLVVWLGLLVGGACLALACLPLCLTAIALFVAEYANMPLSHAFGISVFSALIIAGTLIVLSVYRLRTASTIFDRSWAELRQNIRWAKDALRQLSNAGGINRGPTTTTR